MKKGSCVPKTKKKVDVILAAADLRAKCNRLTDEERQRLLEEGLRVIYGSDAKAHARSR